MASVKGRAKQLPTGQRGMVLLEIAERDIPKAELFFRQKRENEKKSGQEKEIEFEFAIWYKKRTVNQLGLLRELTNRIAEHDNVPLRIIKAGVKEEYYPRVLDPVRGLHLIKETSELNTVEMSKIIENVINECSDKAIDISDIWCLWNKWRGEREVDPLEGTYKNKEDYIARHPVCEGCGKGLVESEAPDGTVQREGQWAHIVPESEGGPDTDGNRLRLCTKCHLEKQHTEGGISGLADLHKHLKGKIDKALKKYGSGDLKKRESKTGGAEDEEGKRLDECENSEYGLF